MKGWGSMALFASCNTGDVLRDLGCQYGNVLARLLSHLCPTLPPGLFNGVKLVVETTEESLFSHPGASVTLPCHYHYEPALASPRPVRVKWWKLSENGVPEQDVLVAIGQRHRSFGGYQGRVQLRQDKQQEVSLELRDLRLEDSGRYRCEVIDGLEDESGLVELELRGEALTWCHWDPREGERTQRRHRP